MTSDADTAASLPPAVEIIGLSKTFPSQVAVSGVDLVVGPGEVHALLGENGSGKSTLIKVLSGFHTPDSGTEVRIGGEDLSFGNPAAAHKLGARFVHQDLGLIPTMSVADNLFLGTGFPTVAGTIRGRALRRLARQALTGAAVDCNPDALVGSLPPAIRTGVAMARALMTDPHSEAKLLVLDEPTATMPNNEVEHLLTIVRAVAAQGVGVIYVTHRIDEIFDIASNVTVLRDGRKIAERPVVGLTRAELVRLLVGDELERTTEISAEVERSHSVGEVVLSASGLTSSRLAGVSFETRAGMVTGIAGITGSGREAVLSTIFGATVRESGTVEVNGTTIPAFSPRKSIDAKVGFVPADRKGAGGIIDLTARENLTLPALGQFSKNMTISRRKERVEASRWFDRLGVRPRTGSELPLAQFSGGNQQKIVLAKWLRCEPLLLLVDEPTQGVDLAAKAEIHRRLLEAAEAGASVVVSCSDADELAALCQRVLVFRRGELVADLVGADVSTDAIARLSHDDGVDDVGEFVA